MSPLTLGARTDAVVIGGSAGAVEALLVLLRSLPEGCTAAVLVVVHLPANRPSLLCEIFAPVCRLPVREGEDKDPIERGTVYVAPPGYHLLIDEGPRIALSVDEPIRFSRPSIDALFESAADVYGERLAGVLLTGANDDGARGLQAIRRAGGICIVQDPATAHASRMPESALALGQVDAVLPLEGIAGLFESLAPQAAR